MLSESQRRSVLLLLIVPLAQWAMARSARAQAPPGNRFANPSFESNLNTNSEPLSPGAPMGWPYYSPIDNWTVVGGGSGVNDLVYDAGGPFHNAGTPVPDGRRIGFKQMNRTSRNYLHILKNPIYF